MFGFNYLTDDKNTTTNYVIDPVKGIVIAFNESWQYLFSKPFASVNNMINVNKTLYITGKSNVFKTDYYLNTSFTYNGNDYGGIYHNSSNSTLYIVSCAQQTIFTFSLALSVVDSISTAPHYPYGIQVNNSKIYVSTTDGLVVVIENRVILQTFQACNNISSPIYSILIDPFGYIATACSSCNATYLYHINGTFTGLSMKASGSPHFISFDSKREFVVLTPDQINIYV